MTYHCSREFFFSLGNAINKSRRLSRDKVRVNGRSILQTFIAETRNGAVYTCKRGSPIANNINRNVYMYLNTHIFPSTGYARVLLFMFIRREL